MSAQNIIELGFNVEELTAEKKVVLDLLTDLFQQLEKYDGTKFNPLGNGGLADLKKSLQDGATAMQEFQEKVANYNKVVTEQFQKQQQAAASTAQLSQATKEYQNTVTAATQAQVKAGAEMNVTYADQEGSLRENIRLLVEYQNALTKNQEAQKQFKKDLDSGAISQEKYNELMTNAIERQLEYKGSIEQVKKELKSYTEIDQATPNSIADAKAQNKVLTRQRDNTDVNDTATIQQLNELIDRNNQLIDANSDKLAKQKINIGNYPQVASIMSETLSQVNARLTEMAAAGDTSSEAFQKLVLEEKILQQAMQKQEAGFASVTAEMRSMRNTLDALTLAGLEQTETFQTLNNIYTDSKHKITELRDQQKILSSEAPGLTALTTAARGLGGAYALGAGTSALFADGNEKVEKELNKLVAIMTLLQGLEEAVRAVKERGAIATALQAQATKLLTVAKDIEAKLFGQSVAVTVADTEAKVINTETQEANTAALEANAAGAEVNTVAMEGTALATEGATAATISFRTALISTGIGAIIIGIIYGITKLVGVIGDWINADEKAAESQKALSESTAELLEQTKLLDEVYAEFTNKRLEYLTRQGEKDKEAGKNQFIQLDNERQLAQRRLELSKQVVDQKGLDESKIAELYEKQKNAAEIVQGYEESLHQAKQDYANDDSSANKKRIEDLEKIITQEKLDAKNAATTYEIARDAYKDYIEAQKDLENNRIAAAKAAAEELAKIQAEAAQRRYEVAKDVNDRILNLDSSTEGQRLQALRGNYNAEQELANSNISAIRKQITDQTITEKDGGSQIANIQTDLNIKYKKYLDDREKLRIEYHDRELAARNSIDRSGNESDAAIQEAITKDTQRELGDRLDALKKNIDDKTKIIVDDYNYQLKLAREHGKTETEIQALAVDRDKQLVDLTADTQKQIYDIVISYGDRRLKAIQDINKTVNSANQVNSDYNLENDQLSQALINRTISYSHFLTQKKLLDDKYAIEKDKADIKDDEEALQRVRDYLQKELNLKIFFAEKELDAAKKGGDDKEIADAQAKVNALLDIQRKAKAEEVALEAKTQKDKSKLISDQSKSTEAIDALLESRKKEIAVQSSELSKTLVDASFENRINKIQEEIDLNDKQASAEVEAIQRSTLARQDQEAEIIIIEANQKARDTALRNEQKQEKIKEAKFDRDVALAQVAWDTAKAVMKDTAGVPWPLSLAIAAADITLGAIQAATILARPIPTYGDGIGIPGKGQHPGGPAWTGERFEPELVTIPGQQPFIVDKPTLLDLPANTQVLPLNPQDIVHDLGWAGLMQGAAMINSRTEQPDLLLHAINNQTARMERAYAKNQRNIKNIVNVHIDAGWDNYVNKKIIGKA
jgi:hypothetical protein